MYPVTFVLIRGWGDVSLTLTEGVGDCFSDCPSVTGKVTLFRGMDCHGIFTPVALSPLCLLMNTVCTLLKGLFHYLRSDIKFVLEMVTS